MLMIASKLFEMLLDLCSPIRYKRTESGSTLISEYFHEVEKRIENAKAIAVNPSDPPTKNISTYNPYNLAMPEVDVEHMPATSRIPVSRAVWAELASLKKPGETFDHLLANMIEREKENRFFEDMDRIEKRGKFVAMEW
jgi:hypothetical protein